MKCVVYALALVAAVANAQLCTTSGGFGSPTVEDCKAAINSLPKPPPGGGPVACLKIYAPRWSLAKKGTCEIIGYSSRGAAACLDRQKVIDAAISVYSTCQLGDFVEGGAAFAKNEKDVFEGVLIAKAAEE